MRSPIVERNKVKCGNKEFSHALYLYFKKGTKQGVSKVNFQGPLLWSMFDLFKVQCKIYSNKAGSQKISKSNLTRIKLRSDKKELCDLALHANHYKGNHSSNITSHIYNHPECSSQFCLANSQVKILP